MNYKLPRLTGAFSLNFVLLLAASMTADEGSMPWDGNELIATAATNLDDLPAFEAKLRQRVRLFGHEMVGSGSYQRMTAGGQRMQRLELKMDVAGQVTSFQQISDGTTLWIRRDSGDEKSLEYINLRQIRQTLARRPDARTFPEIGNWFALGGLDQLLQSLDRNFAFSKPTASQIGAVPVWELNGRWKPAALAQFNVTSADALPKHLPQVVKVTLGHDQQLPLFPYRIEYGRETATQPPAYVAIAAMDLHGVQRRPELVARHFRFQPNEQEVIDVTDLYVSRLIARLEPANTIEK